MEIARKRFIITHELTVFGLVWVGQLISLIGSGLSGLALGVWYYQTEGSVTQLALFSFFNVVPSVLLSPVAGVLVDRWDRRRAMLVSDIGAGLCSVTIWLMLAAGQAGYWSLQPWHLYLPVALSSAFSAFRWPAYYAVTTLLVPKRHLARATGLIEIGPASAQIIAPALAGLLVVSLGLQGVILIDLSTFVFAVVTLLIVRFPRPEITSTGRAAQGNLRQELTFGWKYIRQRPGLLRLLLFVATVYFSLGFVMVLIIPLILSFTGASTRGGVLSIAGSGRGLGGLTMGVWGGPKRLINGVISFALFTGVLLLMSGLRPSVPLVAVVAFLYLFSMPIISGSSQAIWQRKVAPDVQGRVFAVQRMVIMASAPLSRLVVGPLVDHAFEPWLAPGGALAASVGQIIGTGPGRGIAFLLMALGAFNVIVTGIAVFSPRLRRVEEELPDALTDKPVSGQNKTDRKKGNNMKRVRKWVLRIGLGLLVLLLILGATAFYLVRRGWPDINGTFQAPGLQASVQIVRDKWGVPHIYAENDHDLFFAQGYAHAQDRLWQMEMDRNAAKGTLAGLVGKGAVDTDKFIRTIGLWRSAEQDWALLDADTRASLEDYAAGVNAYIDSHRDRLPVEFVMVGVNPEPWQPVDSLSIANLMALSLSHNYRMELLRAQVIATIGLEGAQDLFTPYAKGTPVIVPPEVGNYSWLRDGRFEVLDAIDDLVGDPAPGWGSNNWVVHGSRTATGKPILENDTHLGLQMPSFWYENDLHGGRYHVTGFSLPGTPFVVIGHNQNIAWGETTLGQDVQDYYIEKFDNDAQPTQYEYQGHWQPVEVKHELIAVKGSDPVPLDIVFTRHGPIMTEAMSLWSGITNTQPLAMRWTMYDGNRLAQAMREVNLAATWDDFRTALSHWDAPGVNMVYADVDGNIGYQATGRTPIRVKQHQGLVPVSGWTGEYEWQNFIPFDELPTSFNPPAGYIATANNRVTTDDYPYLLAYDWFPGYRVQRISDLLAANDHVTIDDIKAIEAQTYSLPAEALRPYLLPAVQPATDLETQALELVKNWDLYLERDRVGATIYERWYIFMVENTIGDELGDNLTQTYLAGRYERHGNQHVPMLVDLVTEADNHWFDDTTTPQRETRDDIIRRSFTQTVNWLSENAGKDPQGWAWGNLHTVQFPHITFSSVKPLNLLFNSQTTSLPGDQFAVNAASFRWTRPFTVIHAVSERMIVDLGNLENSLSIHTTGQNEQLGHPHREDFILMWANLQFHPMLSDRTNVDKNVEGTLSLTP